MKIKQLITLLMLWTSFTAYAANEQECKMTGNDTLYHAANIDSQQSFPYALDNALRTTQIPGTRVYKCDKAAAKRKYLLVGFGPVEMGYQVDDLKVFYDDILQPNFCQLKDTQFKPMTFEERKVKFEQKVQFNKICLKRRIKHVSKYPLVFAKNQQKHCKVTKILPNEVYIEGGICFLKIFPDSEFVFSYDINPKCRETQFLSQNGLKPMEVKSYFTANVVKNPSGNSDDFELLGSRLIHARIDPTQTMTNLSETNGLKYPRYINNYYFPEHEISKIELRGSEGSSFLKSTMLINNVCDTNDLCADGVCTSKCDFQRPFAANYSLSKIIPGKRRPYFLKSWHSGGVIPPNWQGTLGGDFQTIKNQEFKTGEKFMLEIEFKDPKFDMVMLQRGLNPLFRTIPGLPSGKFSKALMLGIPTIDDLITLKEIPTVDNVSQIDEGDDFGSFSQGQGIQAINQNGNWPPYYSEVCNGEGDKCRPNGSKTFLKYTIEFTVGAYNQDEMTYAIQYSSIKRSGPLFTQKNLSTSNLPHVHCQLIE